MNRKPGKGGGTNDQGLASHNSIRAHRVDSRMRLCTVTSHMRSDAMPMGSHFLLQDPVRHSANPKGSLGCSRYAPFASRRVGPQLSVAVGLTGLDNTGQRMLLIAVEPNKHVHRAPPVQVSLGGSNAPESYLLTGGSGFIVSVGLERGRRRTMPTDRAKLGPCLSVFGVFR